MRTIRKLALGLLSGAVVASTASEVTSLTKDTFKDFVKSTDLVLAKFYAPWCGHCQALAPEYEEAAVQLKDRSIKLAKIDCTEEVELCQTHGVDGYPTLKIFRGPDNVTPYPGARKAPAIVSHMIKQSLPAVSILTKETIVDFKKADQVVLVAYFNADDKTSNNTYTLIAEKMRDTYLFGAVNDPELAKSEEATFPSIILYKSFDEGKVVHSGKFDQEEIEKFANMASIPLVGEIGPETYYSYMFSGIPIGYIFAKSESDRKSLSDTFRPIAEKYKGKVSFATIDAEAFGAHAGNLNLKADKFPAFAIQETTNNKKYPMDQDLDITAETIEHFVSQFVEGKLEPTIKSEPIPESQKGPVTIVVAKNFDEIVMDDTKDVLIEFYAPWCGHCKALAPKYDILGQLYIDAGVTDKVTIAKIDATANDVTQEIEGFPTIMLFKAGDKKNPLTHSGGRSIEDLIEFVKKGKYEVSVEYSAEMKAKEPSVPEESEDEDMLEEPISEGIESLDDHDEL